MKYNIPIEPTLLKPASQIEPRYPGILLYEKRPRWYSAGNWYTLVSASGTLVYRQVTYQNVGTPDYLVMGTSQDHRPLTFVDLN